MIFYSALSFFVVFSWIVFFQKSAKYVQFIFLAVCCVFMIFYLNINTTYSPDIQEYIRRFSTDKFYLERIYYGYHRIFVDEYRDMAFSNSVYVSLMLALSFLLFDKNQYRRVGTILLVFSTTYIYLAGILNVHRQWAAGLAIIFITTYSRKSSALLPVALIHYSAIAQIILTRVSNVKIIKKGIIYGFLMLAISVLLGYVLAFIKVVHITGRDYGLYFLAIAAFFAILTRSRLTVKRILIWSSSDQDKAIALGFLGLFLGMYINGGAANIERFFLYYMAFITTIIVCSVKNYSRVVLILWCLINCIVTGFFSPMGNYFL
jgi:hypothetical protein